jgi:hypothetical protein
MWFAKAAWSCELQEKLNHNPQSTVSHPPGLLEMTARLKSFCNRVPALSKPLNRAACPQDERLLFQLKIIIRLGCNEL